MNTYSIDFGPHRYVRGFTIVEIMVAMVLSILIMLGALQVYSSGSNSQRTLQASAEMMESGRTAVEMLARSARLAGYWKCDGWELASLTNHLTSEQRGLYSANGANGAPDTLRTLHALDETEVGVTTALDLAPVDAFGVPQPADISVSNGSGFSGSEIIVINDCLKGDVFQLSAASGNSLSHNCTSCVEYYSTDAFLLEVQDTRYFIQNNANGQPALFRSINGGTAEQMVEGVEDLQIFFGEDTDSDGVTNRYVTADVIDAPCADGTNPGCWTRVTSVRISVLMRTLDDNIALTPQSYLYNGQTVTATDRRMRRVFTAVIALRNQRI
jgi:type IV pilus assembly protein PilW